MNKRKHLRHFLLIAALAIILVLAGCSSEGGQVNLPCGHTAEVEAQADHQSCSLCGGYVCSGEHGDGICVEPAADATVSAAAESTPAPVQEPTPAPTPTPIPKSSDSHLRVFNATFPNGKFVDMKDSQARKNITVTNVYSVDVSAITSDSRASVSGDVGTLELEDGINEFIVTVTAEDGSKSHFEYSITVLKPAPKRRPKPSSEPSGSYVPEDSTTPAPENSANPAPENSANP